MVYTDEHYNPAVVDDKVVSRTKVRVVFNGVKLNSNTHKKITTNYIFACWILYNEILHGLR